MDIEKILIAVAQQLKLEFSLENKAISHEQVFSVTGLLPSLAKRANQLSEFCMGRGLGVKFNNNSEAMMGIDVEFKLKQPNSFVLLCFLDVIIQIIKSQGKVPVYILDNLLSD